MPGAAPAAGGERPSAGTPTWEQVLARRLDRHHLAAPGPGPAAVVAAMCGAHAQILTAGELSVGIRLGGAARADVRSALWDDRTLVKTYGPRGTVHLLPTADLAMWTGALAAVPRPLPSFGDGIVLTAAELDAVVAGLGAVLPGAARTVDELDAALAVELGPWAVERTMPAFGQLWPRWRMAVDTAANRGVLCFGPDAGRRITYTSPPPFVPAEGGGSWLLARYLHSYGPATAAHYARWLSAPPAWATALFGAEAAAGRIEPLDGWGWVAAGDTDFPDQAPRGLRLLPYFDAYAVGSWPRDRVFPGRAAERALARSQAGNFPVLLLDGVVGGVWHQKRAGRYLDLTVEPLADLSAARRRALDAEADRVGAFQELIPRLTVGPVTVGPHA